MQSIAETSAASLRIEHGMYRSIVSLDPGGTTGICLGDLSDEELVLRISQQELSMLGMYDFLEKHVGECENPCHVIYESFQYRKISRGGLDLTPVKLIGVIELMRDQYEPLVTFTEQSPATGKAFFSDDRLKQMGIYKPGTQHGRDAERHLMQWITFGYGSQYVDINKIKAVLADG
jgi:hypothetical protein